jgi:hypothetical protein
MNSGTGLQRTTSYDFDLVRKDSDSLVGCGTDPASGVEAKKKCRRPLRHSAPHSEKRGLQS